MTKKLLFIGTAADVPYLSYLKSCLPLAEVTLSASTAPISTLYEIVHTVKKRGFDGVLTSSLPVLQKLLGAGVKISTSEASINNYAGSYFTHQDIPFVILNPLAQLITVPYGKFLASRYITKLSAKQRWPEVSKFNWTLLAAGNINEFYEKLATARLIAVDIETAQNPLRITCIGYTGVFTDNTSISVVLPIDSLWAVAHMRKLNSLSPPKVFQNGKYDNAYLCAFSAPITNWLYDTANLFHSWYSELPKDLGFLNAFCVREAAYWKDLANTNDKYEYYKYNALDTWATANACMALITEMPQWAINNYLNEFPLNFPCHLSEMTGIHRDSEELKKQAAVQDEIVAENNKSLDRMLGVSNFNTNSPIQKRALLTILGCKDIAAKSADEKSLKKAAFRHPLNARILGQIIKVQKAKKLKSTYLTAGKEFNGKVLYSLNPHGTETSRLASREHPFWCGLNIQNIPRGPIVKSTLIAPPGFLLAEVDLEQAESRDTAHIAGDEKLIAAVSGTKDFHSANASAFFGIPYEEIYDDSKKKTINKDIRDLAKRVNHGANYNMGANIMVETMGEEMIFKAAVLLKLPRGLGAKQIAEYLLSGFHKTYPSLSGTYYPAITHEIEVTNRLTSNATHEAPYQAASKGLTRYCFGSPRTNKRDLNAYIAHAPQSLNAMTLNKAYMRIFYEIAINPEHSNNFKLLAQVHDSVLFAFREGHEYLIEEVKWRMEIPVTVTGADGKLRKFIVPAAPSKGGESWAST